MESDLKFAHFLVLVRYRPHAVPHRPHHNLFVLIIKSNYNLITERPFILNERIAGLTAPNFKSNLNFVIIVCNLVLLI